MPHERSYSRDVVLVFVACCMAFAGSRVAEVVLRRSQVTTASAMQATTQAGGSMVYVFVERDCPYCNALRPSVQRAIREGYPIAEMDVASPLGRLAVRQLGLTKVPTLAVFDPHPADPRQLQFRTGSQPRVVLKDTELRDFLRLENIKPKGAQ